ncbi:hypothetical protein G7Y89_g13361 [Cudoniella acicularis]|uniref:Uncharacterized protein n=1 Tax=Cudoniella acicularis TaxID=354080 RepID=A0A8H4VW54_9HELO|nr:hypothetical protein G7Y89_g13361 [Cudoniella acicularis]
MGRRCIVKAQRKKPKRDRSVFYAEKKRVGFCAYEYERGEKCYNAIGRLSLNTNEVVVVVANPPMLYWHKDADSPSNEVEVVIV